MSEEKQAVVVPFNRPKAPVPRCSFCNRSKDACKQFVSNHEGTHHICGDCIKHAKARVEELT